MARQYRSHPNNLIRACAKHLQGVKALFAPKIEEFVRLVEPAGVGQDMTSNGEFRIRIPNRPPPDPAPA